jgi:hypothetical protein
MDSVYQFSRQAVSRLANQVPGANPKAYYCVYDGWALVPDLNHVRTALTVLPCLSSILVFSSHLQSHPVGLFRLIVCVPVYLPHASSLLVFFLTSGFVHLNNA